MRRIRRLESCEYLIHLGQKTQQILTSCNHSNVLLERTWHKQSRATEELEIRAKFNADAMNGIQIFTRVHKNGKSLSSIISSAKLYRIDEADWSETLVSNLTMTGAANGDFTVYLNQTALTSSNELSGMETYSIEIKAQRRREKYYKKMWFNHIGCFDSIWRIRNEIHYLNSTKVDE